MLDYLAPSLHKGRSSVLPQLDVPMGTHGRSVPFWMEIEEEWMGKGLDGKQEGKGGEEGGEIG